MNNIKTSYLNPHSICTTKANTMKISSNTIWKFRISSIVAPYIYQILKNSTFPIKIIPYQKEFLNLRLNCYLYNLYNHLNKRTEIELLFQNIQKLQAHEKISTLPKLFHLLKAKGIKNRFYKNNKSMLTKELKVTRKQLRNHPNILIKKAN